MASDVLNNNKKEASQKETFTEELMDIASKGALCFAISLGFKLGLIDILRIQERPLTAKQLADSAGLKERYVKEWLSVLSTGGIVEISSDGEYYFLPMWKRGPIAGEDPMSMQALFMIDWLSQISTGNHVKKLLEVYNKDGPPGLELEQTPLGSVDITYDKSAKLAKDDMTKMLRAIPELEKNLESGIQVLELGCNNGILSRYLSQRFPASTFHGVDIDHNTVQHAQKIVKQKELSNITFHTTDICHMPSEWSGTYDYVFAYKVLHDISRPRDALKSILQVLKKGGKFSMFEYNVSSNSAENVGDKLATSVYFGSLVHCLPYSIGLHGGEGLGACWGITTMKSYLSQAGFQNVYVADPDSRPLVHIVGTK